MIGKDGFIMIKTKAVISSVLSFAMSLILVAPVTAHAAQVWVTGVEDGSFLEKYTTYNFTVSSNKSFNNIKVDYTGHYIGSDGPSSYLLVDHNYSPDVTVTSGESLYTGYINGLAPYYDPSTGKFLKNNLKFDITHTDDTHSQKAIHCNVLGWYLSEYASSDSTFYYTSPKINSFISSKTRAGYNVAQNNYNCLSYAVHEEDNGWLWPFGDYATGAAVTYWFYGEGYTQNTTTNHNFAHVIAYGKYDSSLGENGILHFAKVTDWSADGTPIEINSKWGQLEVIHSSSTSPFTSSINYGSPLIYFNKISNNNSSIVYNPATNTYYDSMYKTWNPNTYSYDYIDILFSSNNSKQSVQSQIEKKKCSNELSLIYQNYRKKIDEYTETIPNYESISYVITDDGKGAASKLITSSIPYYDQIFDIATHDGYENFDSRTAQFIITNTLKLNVFYSKPDKYYNDVKEQYELASESVEKYGSDITMEECQVLQKKYGYLIAPALNNIGKSEYLQFEDSDYCKDIATIIEICNLFD